MQVHLPQDMASRFGVNVSQINGVTGVGFGYAYMMDNERNSALTLSVGMAGDETAVRGSFGFEFGGERKMELPVAAMKYAPAPVVVAEPEPEPEPEPTGVLVPFAEYDELVAQAEAAEAVEEYAEQSEYRYAQQQSYLDELELEHQRDDAEIEALKKRVEEEVAEADARRAAVRAKYADKEAKSDGPESPDK